MHSTLIPYHDQETTLEGFVAYPGEEKKRPLVILCHTWGGRDEFICEKARLLAKLGYVGFALDMYGKGILGKSKAENAALKKPFIHDRRMLQRRVIKGMEAAAELPYTDSRRIAVMGFGFGGICALDLARSGADLRGAVSIYGHFDPPPSELVKAIRAKILVLHGYLDPIVPLDELARFEKEMSRAKVDWQVHLFGNAMHAFATPGVSDTEAGLLYDPLAAKRAWSMAQSFLAEVLG
jgi:dienelactone hydrolase